jgi:hypothetical protein
MNKPFSPKRLTVPCLMIVTLGLTPFSFGAGKDAHLSEVIRDVKVLASKAAAGRAASVNDPVQEGQAVRTGGDSRAELTFTDQTITRLGSNTLFSYGQGAKQMDLSSGAALVVVPKEAGTVRINTAAATASVTGFTVLVESHANALNKFMVLEGEACVKKIGKHGTSEPCTTLHSGEMLMVQPGTRNVATIQKFDIKKTLNSAHLITKFGKLPKWARDDLQTAVQHQGGGGKGNNPPGGNNSDPTGVGTLDQRANASPTPPAAPKTEPPPPPGIHGKP